jgi:hypothetical protein
MPQVCKVCVHPNREQIDLALRARQPHAVIGRRFALSNDSVDRHVKAQHAMRGSVDAMKSEAETARRSGEAEKILAPDGEGILGKLEQLIGIARGVMDRAVQINQLSAAMAGVRELARIFELIAKLTGQLDEGAKVNILIAQHQQREAEQELMLERLTLDERRELRRLVAKTQGEPGGAPAPPGIDVSAAANGIAGGNGDGGSQALARIDRP